MMRPMEGFDPRTSFGYEVSMEYDALETRGDEEETIAFLARLANTCGLPPTASASGP